MMYRRARFLRTLLVLSLFLAIPVSPAWADDIRTVEAVGDAAADAESARVRAIDIALAEAVGQVVIDTVDARMRRRYRAELNLRVVRRARRFVAGFKVLDEGESEGRYRVRISARVDLARMRVELDDIGIRDGDTSTPGSEPRPELAILVHEAAADQVKATFGDRATRDGIASRAVTRRLGEAGFALRDASRVPVPISRELPEGMPLSDEAAAEMARSARAGGAWVMSVRAESSGAIRGTPLRGAVARATVRVLDVDRSSVSLVARVAIESAGFGATDEDALTRALERVADRAIEAMASALGAYWPPMVAAQSDDTLLVEIRGFRGWQQVSALVDGLARARGIDRVWPRELGTRGVVLAVATKLAPRRVSALIDQAGAEGARVEALDQRTLLVTFERAAEVGP